MTCTPILRHVLPVALLVCSIVTGSAWAQLSNAGFETADRDGKTPAKWRSAGSVADAPDGGFIYVEGTVETGEVHEGKRAVAIKGSNNKTARWYSDYIPVTEGSRYVLTVWVKPESLQHGVDARADTVRIDTELFAAASGKRAARIEGKPYGFADLKDKQWQKLEVTITVPDETPDITRARIALRLYGGDSPTSYDPESKVTFDDLSMTDAPPEKKEPGQVE